jgi:hypothetical protein
MYCLYCRRKIGLLRRFTETEYCSPDHRVKMRALSARALREQQAYGDEYEEVSSVFVKSIHRLSNRSTIKTSSSGSTITFTVLVVIALIVGIIGVPESKRQPANPVEKTGAWTALRAKLRSYAAVKVTDDFKSGLNSWISVGSGVAHLQDWSYRDGFVRPGRLRLLKDSLSLTNYQIEFTGEIEQKGLSWVYRAKDAKNYYASKIVVTQPRPLPRAVLVRYALINGIQQSRVSVPLPVAARADALYKVEMTVRASDFSAIVNGSIVDTWSDARISTGGVGFFSDKDEVATLRYVSVTDKDTLLGRVLSYLGFLHPLTPVF